jgi:hypothetical protein
MVQPCVLTIDLLLVSVAYNVIFVGVVVLIIVIIFVIEPYKK